MDADPGATAERLSSSQGQMWVNLGGQTTSYSSCGMWVGKTGGRWWFKSTAGFTLIGFQNRIYKPKTTEIVPICSMRASLYPEV
jgi:hypothetical protein